MGIADSAATWPLIAAAIGLLALGLMAFGIIGDRSRGRRRCPRCWYDLQATAGLRCNECGVLVKKEKHLHRARRRRWAIALGVFILPGAWMSLKVPQARREGWCSVTPTPILIIALPFSADAKSPIPTWLGKCWATPQLMRMSGMNTTLQVPIPRWQRWMLARSCNQMLGPKVDPSLRSWALTQLDRLGPEAAPAVSELSQMLDESDSRLVYRVLRCLGRIGPDAAPCTPRLIRFLADPVPKSTVGTRACAIETLGLIGPRAAEGVPALSAIVDQRTYEAYASIKSLKAIGPSAASALPALCGYLRPSRQTYGRADAAAAIGAIGPQTAEAAQALVQAVTDDDVQVRDAAAAALIAHPKVLDAAISQLRILLHGDQATDRMRAAQSLLAMGQSAAPAAGELANALHDPDPLVRFAAAQALAEIGPAAARQAASPVELASREDPDPAVRTMAAAAMQRIAPMLAKDG